jgi:hypothetical protein
VSASSVILAIVRRLGTWIAEAVIRRGLDWAAARCALGIRRIRKKKRRIAERMRRAKSGRKLSRLAAKIRFHDWRIRWRWKAIKAMIGLRSKIQGQFEYYMVQSILDGVPRVADTVGRWRDDEASQT